MVAYWNDENKIFAPSLASSLHRSTVQNNTASYIHISSPERVDLFSRAGRKIKVVFAIGELHCDFVPLDDSSSNLLILH